MKGMTNLKSKGAIALKPCPFCGGHVAAKADDTHLNPASVLPPTRTPLLIEVDGELVKVERTTHVSDREHDREYVTKTGAHIAGKYRWTYQ